MIHESHMNPKIPIKHLHIYQLVQRVEGDSRYSLTQKLDSTVSQESYSSPTKQNMILIINLPYSIFVGTIEVLKLCTATTINFYFRMFPCVQFDRKLSHN